MAEIDIEQKQAGQKTWVWASLAIVAVVGLMLWLASQEVDEGPVMAEGDTTGIEQTAGGQPADEPGTEVVELTAIAGDAASFTGRTVRVNDVDVAATLGDRGFWANVSGQNPFLVIVDEGAGDVELQGGEGLSVRGTVVEVTKALADEWVAGGAIREGARDEATFASYYLRADQIR
jgi:hypothetical protein